MSVFSRIFTKGHAAVCLTTIAFLSLVVNPALATTYECKTKQAYQWKDGVLKPSAFFKDTVIRFDDQTSTIWIASSENVPFAPIPVKIDLPIGTNNDLIVSKIPTTKDANGKEPLVRNIILKIRGWRLDKDMHFQPTKLSFFFYEDSVDVMDSGECTKSD